MDSNKVNKIAGYALIILGLIIIFYSSISAYNVFTGKTKVFNIFNFAPIALDLSKYISQNPVNTDAKQELVNSDILNKPTNLAAHLLLMTFLASVGYKIASIGVLLVRTIKVNLKQDN